MSSPHALLTSLPTSSNLNSKISAFAPFNFNPFPSTIQCPPTFYHRTHIVRKHRTPGLLLLYPPFVTPHPLPMPTSMDTHFHRKHLLSFPAHSFHSCSGFIVQSSTIITSFPTFKPKSPSSLRLISTHFFPQYNALQRSSPCHTSSANTVRRYFSCNLIVTSSVTGTDKYERPLSPKNPQFSCTLISHLLWLHILLPEHSFLMNASSIRLTMF